jgi:hypothetical protein
MDRSSWTNCAATARRRTRNRCSSSRATWSSASAMRRSSREAASTGIRRGRRRAMSRQEALEVLGLDDDRRPRGHRRRAPQADAETASGPRRQRLSRRQDQPGQGPAALLTDAAADPRQIGPVTARRTERGGREFMSEAVFVIRNQHGPVLDPRRRMGRRARAAAGAQTEAPRRGGEPAGGAVRRDIDLRGDIRSLSNSTAAANPRRTQSDAHAHLAEKAPRNSAAAGEGPGERGGDAGPEASRAV